MQNTIEFLQKEGILAPDHSQWFIRFADGREVDFVEIMARYGAGMEAKRATATDLLRRCRTHQREFYAAKPGTLARSDAFKESRKAEQEADMFLREQDAPAPRASQQSMFF